MCLFSFYSTSRAIQSIKSVNDENLMFCFQMTTIKNVFSLLLQPTSVTLEMISIPKEDESFSDILSRFIAAIWETRNHHNYHRIKMSMEHNFHHEMIFIALELNNRHQMKINACP
jgi:hypothetical protein